MTTRLRGSPLAMVAIGMPLLFVLLLAGNPTSSGASAAASVDPTVVASSTPQATAVGTASPVIAQFDVWTYERYVRAHNRHTIPYAHSSGHLFKIAAAWMKHRALCGGAITPVSVNLRTLSHIQSFQGCWAQRLVGKSRVRFHKAVWMP